MDEYTEYVYWIKQDMEDLIQRGLGKDFTLPGNWDPLTSLVTTTMPGHHLFWYCDILLLLKSCQPGWHFYLWNLPNTGLDNVCGPDHVPELDVWTFSLARWLGCLTTHLEVFPHQWKPKSRFCSNLASIPPLPFPSFTFTILLPLVMLIWQSWER